ncbi:MAG: S24 family peptidase [Hyphomicrobiaceae bacterium]|nr:S24 family peptidase [Hyphomicrobiaceae bacterium]MCC0024604.1 S24 family peptidase [Hyphomicrobiaceae bacterium]
MTKPAENDVYLRIRARLDEVHPGLTDREASLRATDGRNADLFRKLKSGPVYTPRGQNLAGLAELLQVGVDWVLALTDRGSSANPPAPRPDARIVKGPPIPKGPATVPVMGTAQGSILPIGDNGGFEGFLIDMTPIQWARMPDGLANQRDIYAIFVEGDSMDPMHPPGTIRFVQPHRPPAPGDTVIVQTKHWEHEPGQAYIKIYRRRGGGKLILEQINPRAIVEIPLEFVTAIHRVATDNDLFLF